MKASHILLKILWSALIDQGKSLGQRVCLQEPLFQDKSQGMGPEPEDDWFFKILTVAVQSST